MADELPDSHSLLCSACLAPCAGAEAHVPEVRGGFCDFLERHRFRQDAARLRLAPPEEQLAVFAQLLSAVEDGRLVFDP